MALPENPTLSTEEGMEPTPLTLEVSSLGEPAATGIVNPPQAESKSAMEGNQQQPENQNRSSDIQEDSVSKKRKGPKEDKTSGPSHPLWKTSLCSYSRRHNGNCRHGDACKFAHGEAELRPRPDNSWDPTSERAKKLQKSDGREGVEPASASRADPILAMDNGEESVDVALDKCLVHLPMNWKSETLKSFLDEQGISYKTANKKKGMTVAFISFASKEQVNSAIEGLDGKSLGSKQIKVGNVLPRSFEKKPAVVCSLNSEACNQSGEINSASEDTTLDNEVMDGKEKLAKDESVSRTRSARGVVTPLAHLPYADQLEHKKNSISQSLKRLTRNARKACPDGVSLPEWILKSREIGGLPCKFEGILESPVVNGYRNKCEFSVGYSLQGKLTVGFMLGNFREGMTAVEEPVDCPNVSAIACRYASIFQDFLQSSDLPVWNRINNSGFWRQFTVREGRNPTKTIDGENDTSHIAEVMLIVQVCSSGVASEVMESEFEQVAQALSQGASECSPRLPLSALVIQDHQGISNAAPADCLLTPLPIQKDAQHVLSSESLHAPRETRIHDYINNLCFSISPTAFFQVNTLAAEKLYSLAGDWANLGPDTLLFDICCGTGTIGLTMAHRVGMVVGIEMNESAVFDAQRNAEINGIKNCRFVCAKAEAVMGTILKEYLDVPLQEETAQVDKGTDQGRKVVATMDCRDTMDTDTSTLETGKKGSTEENMALVSTTKDDALDASLLEGMPNDEMVEDKSISGCGSCNEKADDLTHKDCTSENSKTSRTTVRQFKDVVAIVDPPRGGLHPTVIKALRTHPRLRRLVYISCNPESLVANAIELCTPTTPVKPDTGKKNNGGWRKMSSAGLARHRAKSMPNSEPFKPIKAVAVDLFPHTLHCEMVMLLER